MRTLWIKLLSRTFGSNCWTAVEIEPLLFGQSCAGVHGCGGNLPDKWGEITLVRFSQQSLALSLNVARNDQHANATYKAYMAQ